MPSRLVAALVAIALASAPSAAADLGAEPVAPQERAERAESCSGFGSLWLWGDPRDCPGDETVPACDAPSVVRAAERFVRRADPAYRAPAIAALEPVRELHDTFTNPSPRVRRYCAASVLLESGGRADAYYVVEEDAGFVGVSWSVYVCVDGHDRWRVYDGRCRVARPTPRF